VPGHDVAGIVEAVGADCRRLRAGDCVWGSALSAGTMAMGTFGEYVVLPEAVLDAKPTNLTFAEAASLPVASLTALQALKAASLCACASRKL
jgi:NADPH:quinone reductase-like Zn-dependent oxidoreductase